MLVIYLLVSDFLISSNPEPFQYVCLSEIFTKDWGFIWVKIKTVIPVFLNGFSI